MISGESGFNKVNLIAAVLLFALLFQTRNRIRKSETRKNNVVTRTTTFMKTGFTGAGTRVG